MRSKVYVQYGSGTEAVSGWESFDASPTLRIQRLPVIGRIIRNRLNCIFDDGVRYGNIVKGLPFVDESVDVVFCSHVLEHLALEDFYIALQNTFRILRPNGIFRLIVPNLRLEVDDYCDNYASKLGGNASIEFLRNTNLGRVQSPKSLKALLMELFGNSKHLWMWDDKSLADSLIKTGFIDIQPFTMGDSGLLRDEVIIRPERPHQFERGLAIQCRKP